MCTVRLSLFCFFFFNDTATTEIYTLSLHDALPILEEPDAAALHRHPGRRRDRDHRGRDRDHEHHADERERAHPQGHPQRSEEHTSELQSQSNLVCRLLLEKKKAEKENII